MKILYLDCYSGISGDMFLGALVDAGLDLYYLRRELAKLGLKGYKVEARRISKKGISCTKVDVIVKKGADKKERTLKEIQGIIQRSKLANDVKDRACAIFEKLAKAESVVHGKSVKNIHLHEVGSIDSIVDIVGAAIGLKALKIDRVYSSFVSVGEGGIIATGHGELPVPAPATLCLLKGIPILSSGIRSELVTPTGAAIISSIVEKFTGFPEMRLSGIGYGAGTHDIKERPNCLRVMVGEKMESFEGDEIFVLEVNIDDMNPVDYEHLFETLFAKGALDVYITPVLMKKTRPGIVLTVLTEKDKLDLLSSLILDMSTAIGVRYYATARKKLKREFIKVKTRYGSISVKVSSGPEGIKKFIPEYDDCKAAAVAKKVPIAKVRGEVNNVILSF